MRFGGNNRRQGSSKRGKHVCPPQPRDAVQSFGAGRCREAGRTSPSDPGRTLQKWWLSFSLPASPGGRVVKLTAANDCPRARIQEAEREETTAKSIDPCITVRDSSRLGRFYCTTSRFEWIQEKGSCSVRCAVPAEVRTQERSSSTLPLQAREGRKRKKEKRAADAGVGWLQFAATSLSVQACFRSQGAAHGRRQTTARRRPHLGEVRPVKFHASCAMRMQLLARKRERERHEIVKSGWEKQLTFRVHKCFGLIKHLFSDLNKNSDVPDLLFYLFM